MPVLKAILGPTNTGKTHYALERMMGHTTGMIGLPLRLLAREVYDRIVRAKGPRAVALVTGEERIIPDQARYWVCTVESMPTDKRVEFLAIDEIQIAEDEDRGHVFTDRILNMRGTQETLLLGAETMRQVLRDLDFDISTDIRERFSELNYAGSKKITKLPKRTAIVAFSADQVYAIAEVLRRQRGGSAVVMGGLSPRTRNAQVELYQSGEVDYLVATDAIGMGLNLDVDRVAFAGRAKFDGRRRRWLSSAELGQIAGRAGRFRDDGEFGETNDCPPFEEDVIHAIEEHRYDSVTDLQWRNSKLDYRSIKTLIASLARPSTHPVLRQNPHGLDEWVLRRMADDGAIGPEIRGQRQVRRLWDLARLPDFRKAGHEGHGRLVLGLAETLSNPDARLGDDAMHKRLSSLDNTLGDISRLQQRLAMIRTWTYASFRPDWLEKPDYWRETTRAVEDRLSDALHEALTLRFVDRRTTALIAGLKREDLLTTDVSDTGIVTIEGHQVGKLVGLTFEPEDNSGTLEGKTLRSAAVQALAPVIAEKLKSISGAPEAALTINEKARIVWNEAPVAQLIAGPHWLAPSAKLIGGQDAEQHQQDAATTRLNEWLGAEIQKRLPTHFKMKFSPDETGLEGLARGLAFRLLEAGAATDLRNEDRALQPGPEDRTKLKDAGIRSGRIAAHIPDAQKPAAQRLVAVLQTLADGRERKVAPEGAGSFELDGTWPNEDLAAQGYLRFGKRAVRADLAERLGWELSKRRKEAEKATFEIPPELASVVSCPLDDFHNVLKGFGIAPAEKDAETGAVKLWRFQSRARLVEQKQRRENRPPRKPRGDANKTGDRPRGNRRGGDNKGGNRPQGQGGRPRHQGAHRRPAEKQPDPNSPFAALAALLPPPPAAPAPKKKKRKPKAKIPAGIVNPAETKAESNPNPAPNVENTSPIPDQSSVETPKSSTNE
ncbi:MAG: helicase-related protein [Henriciella sp.]|jgi:ATP-dependent RNA helicase SUPV3L1/SUV3